MIEKPRSEWIIIPDSHPSIVSKEEFERVQEILKSPKEALTNGRERSNHAKKLYDRIESGERKPTATLYGYRINSSKELEIDTSAAEVVKLIFDLALQGCSARDIAEELQAHTAGRVFQNQKRSEYSADIQVDALAYT
ncbi:MAG: recombinase family protein [Oscillospiraceae bacterium]|jgi:hypothetical protein|nr:recombinase family protein [Oscillospiraceae bacterium]